MRAQHPIDVPMLAFPEQVKIKIGDLGRKSVRIDMAARSSSLILPEDRIMLGNAVAVGNPTLKQIGAGYTLHGRARCTNPGAFRFRQQGSEQLGPVLGVSAENREGIMVARIEKKPQAIRQGCPGVFAEVVMLIVRVHFGRPLVVEWRRLTATLQVGRILPNCAAVVRHDSPQERYPCQIPCTRLDSSVV